MKRRQLTPTEKACADQLRAIWNKKKKQMGLTQEKAAHLMGWSAQGSAGQYLNGRIPLNTDAIIKFADLLEVSPSEIDPDRKWHTSDQHPATMPERDLGAGNLSPGPSIKGYVPLISSVAAGQWSEIVDSYVPGDAEEWRETTASVGPHTFALRVDGDSMTASAGISIPDGAIVIVDPDIEAINGSIVVAKLEDSQEATLKRLVIDGPHRYLKPLNPMYHPIQINGNCRIVGVVRKFEFDLL